MDQMSPRIQIAVNFDEILNKCADRLSSVAESINLLYHSAAAYSPAEIPMLPTDTLPLKMETAPGKTIDEIRTGAMTWLFIKGLADIIATLHESLVDAYQATMIARFLHQGGMDGVELVRLEPEIGKKMSALSSAARKMHFPALIEKIEAELKKPLWYAKEVLSINAVRRCLMHENGKAIPPKQDGPVTLEYLTLIFYFTKDGIKKEMTWEDKISQAVSGEISGQLESRSVIFPMHSDITIDHNIFNALIFTSMVFVEQLRANAYHHFASPADNGL